MEAAALLHIKSYSLTQILLVTGWLRRRRDVELDSVRSVCALAAADVEF